MTPDHLLLLFATYKYFILYPLAILEGHVISLISGFLAREGLINPYIAGAVIASGNLTGDILFYILGYFKGESFLKKWGAYFGVTTESIEKSKRMFHTYHGRILFFTKLTNGFGLQIPILFTAGLSKVPFFVYMFWNALGEILWTGGLVTLGYIFGQLYTKVESTFAHIAVAIGIVLSIFALFTLHKALFKLRKNPTEFDQV